MSPLHDRRDLIERTIRKLRNSDGGPLEELDAELEYLYHDLRSTKDDPQDVETYDGKLGVSRHYVNQYERPVGQLRWLDDLTQRYNGCGDSPGNVNGVKWGSGALIADDLFRTAGHCFRQSYAAWKVPRRHGATISPEEMAAEMYVVFNYQVNGCTGRPRLGMPYPVLDLLEYSTCYADYAILRLGRDAGGRLPGKVFGWLRMAKNDLTTKNAILCIIQHPNRDTKKIEAGHLLDFRCERLAYNDIGTGGGASGAPILSGKTGEIVGVHVRGGSLPIGGFNSGTAIGAIRAMSKLLNLAEGRHGVATHISSAQMIPTSSDPSTISNWQTGFDG